MDARIEDGGARLCHHYAISRLQASIKEVEGWRQFDVEDIERAEKDLAKARASVAERDQIIAEYQFAIHALESTND